MHLLYFLLQTQPTAGGLPPPPVPKEDQPEPDYEVIEFHGQQTYSNTTPPALPAKTGVLGNDFCHILSRTKAKKTV